MERLRDSDSPARVEDATYRHMRLCAQVPNANKYSTGILPSYNEMVAKMEALKKAKRDTKAANDNVELFDFTLDDTLRDVQGRAKEYDRKNPGSNTDNLIFPGGNITPVITMPNKEEPDAAHSISQKIVALGASHTLYPLAALIDADVTKCRTALEQQTAAIKAEGEAKTALSIAKLVLVRKYNANYFLAANDVDKNFAEKLFPKLSPPTKDDSEDEDTTK